MAQYFTQQNSYHVVMEMLPELQGNVDSLDKIYITLADHGRAGAAGRLRQVDDAQDRAAVDQPPGPVPGRHHQLQPGAGRIARHRDRRPSSEAEREMQVPPSLIGTFQGNAQAFQDSLRTVPLLIVAALFVVYLILGILYESYIHPLTILSTLPSAGAGAIAALMLFGFDFSLVAMIGVILLIGIVKKNGIMMVDFAITAERERAPVARPRPCARRRCCASARS